MKTTLENYWDIQFREFKKSKSFNIPNFPFPLMSAHFGVTNLIEGFKDRVLEKNEFFLGEFTSKDVNEDSTEVFTKEELTLKQALKNEDYLTLMSEGFSSDYSFLTGLLSFLATFNYHVLLFKIEGELVACCTVGIAEKFGLVLNTTISKKRRGQNLTQEIFEKINKFAKKHNVQKLSFWTKYKALLRYVDHSYLYKIIHH